MKKVKTVKAGIIAALVLVVVGSVFAVKKVYAGKAATTNTAMASEIIESEATSEKVTSGEDETNPSTEIETATAKKEMVANNNKIATETMKNEETENEETDNSLKTEHEEVVTSTVVEETIEENKASSITNINIESNGDKNIYTETVPVIKETEINDTNTNVIVEEIPVTPSYSIISASTTKTTDTVSSSVYEESAPDIETETTTETETKTETETETVTDMNNVSVNGNISVDFDLF